MLAIASFWVPVVDFQAGKLLSYDYMNNIEPLLSFVGEVHFCGNLLFRSSDSYLDSWGN
ncbi:hypothetical protein BDR04DRAFT_1110437 [Suillus decipiens]|nr:hypothetical protein BDR04DRAFT_1110437 [Suillus decipiens]